ncbi:unnamed protein product [Danaus chrysippus]|uniref:(African queen) hypothetical protein n=1 Tax=Danaus chrysippus TaxID=151541 RepID=A0A8J2QVQ8_9NEOP|nr:unnamed protein product [Danaus chrysippus]
MLKYFNENISLALQERYRDLHEYRKAEVEDSPREAKVPKIAEEGDTVGGEGAFEPSAAPPYPRLLEPAKEEDNFVTSWLHNSFKMTAAEGNNEATAGGSALDLRAAPLSLHIPLQNEAQRFKMQDFWTRSRPGSPAQETADHNQAGPAPQTPQPPATPDHKIITEKLVNEIQQQQSPSADSTMSERSLVPFALVNLLSSLNNIDPQQQSPSGEADRTMLPFALQQARSGQSISERTLEECWSTLQRIFMHKNAMQMHARELQRGLGGEVKPHQCQQCLKSFSSNHQLVQHIRVHTGEKPYKCSYCDRRFKQLSHVQQHTRLHTVIREPHPPQKQSVTRTTFIIKTTFQPLVGVSAEKKHLLCRIREKREKNINQWPPGVDQRTNQRAALIYVLRVLEKNIFYVFFHSPTSQWAAFRSGPMPLVIGFVTFL